MLGSSPHTRGTRAGSAGGRRAGRFIPAYAGNAAEGRDHAIRLLVHPRIRGERLGGMAENVRKGGSSPHTRGTL